MNQNVRKSIVEFKERVDFSRQNAEKRFYKSIIKTASISFFTNLLIQFLMNGNRLHIFSYFTSFAITICLIGAIAAFNTLLSGNMFGDNSFEEQKEAALLSATRNANYESSLLERLIIELGFNHCVNKYDKPERLVLVISSNKYQMFKSELIKNNNTSKLFKLKSLERSYLNSINNLWAIRNLKEEDLEEIC